MTKVLVVHGAGINMRGKSQIEIFGPDTMEAVSLTHLRAHETAADLV